MKTFWIRNLVSGARRTIKGDDFAQACKLFGLNPLHYEILSER